MAGEMYPVVLPVIGPAKTFGVPFIRFGNVSQRNHPEKYDGVSACKLRHEYLF
jgi:hypothetical protein